MVLLFALIIIFICFAQNVKAQNFSFEQVIISDDLTSSDIFTVYSPKEVCYNKSSILLNFSLTAQNLGTIGYSLDNETIQGIKTTYVDAQDIGDGSFQDFSNTKQLTVIGTLAIEDLKNGNHTLRVYLGHQLSTSQFEIEAFTEVNFSIKAPNILLVQKQDSNASDDVSLELIVSEPTWLIYSLDNRANDTISGNTTLTGLSSGFHNITVYAFNGAGSWCASNTINFEISANTVDRASPNSSFSISQQPSEFPLVMILVVFAVLICCMFPIIEYLETANEEAEKSK